MKLQTSTYTLKDMDSGEQKELNTGSTSKYIKQKALTNWLEPFKISKW